MMLPPDPTAKPSDAFAYDEPRGTCPKCGSGEVTHFFWGMPTQATYEGSPAWVSFGGCCLPEVMADRACSSCGYEWAIDDDGNPVTPRRLGSNGRVRARLWNFDGRHNDSPGVVPLGVDDRDRVVEGELFIEDVNTPFVEVQFLVAEDDGQLTLVEEDTIERC